MFWNYLLTGWRNLMRHKAFSLINILGLSLGMAGAVFISLFSGVAILLGALSIFALAAYTTVLRTREIGFRVLHIRLASHGGFSP